MNIDHPEHLQKFITEIVERLGFPEVHGKNGKNLDQKLTEAIYVVWQVLARVCGKGVKP